MKYQIVIGNIGTVMDTDNRRNAIHDYREWVLQSKHGHGCGKAKNEPVTLMRDGEPWREYDPNADYCFFAEVTDTFGGEANYCWVNRYLIKAKTFRGAVAKLTRASGYSMRLDSNFGDSRKYKVPNACICAFVQWADVSDFEYSNLKRI